MWPNSNSTTIDSFLANILKSFADSGAFLIADMTLAKAS
jgi:hypothetical protein